MLDEASIADFRRVAKVHEDWLVYALVGPDLLTKGELENLHTHGELPLDEVLNLPTISYMLGKHVAHLKVDEYKSLNYSDLSYDLTELEHASVADLRLRAASEIRQVAQRVSDTMTFRIQEGVRKGVQTAALGGDNVDLCIQAQMAHVASEVFSKSFTIFQNLHSLAMLDLIHVSKSQAHLNAMVQHEGIYTEGLDSQVMVEAGGVLTPLTARDLMTKSLSGMTLHYVPPGGAYQDGKIVLVDQSVFEESLRKALGGDGPSTPPGGAKPGSIPGVAAPGNEPGPGRGNTQNTPKSGVEYDQWLPQGAPRPTGEGWEQSQSGGWRHIKGAGGSGGAEAPESVEERMVQQKMEAQHWGLKKKNPAVVMDHLSNGTISSMEALGDSQEAGINVAHIVTIDGNGRGIMKPAVDKMSEYQEAALQGELSDAMTDSDGDFAPNQILGNGFGAITQGTEHNHEAAGHKLGALLGSDLVPPTTTRAFGGEAHSIQSVAENHASTGAWLKGRMSAKEWGEEPNMTARILSKVPEQHKEKFMERLNELVVMDVVMNNNDRHADNIVINSEGSDFQAIDHGLSFGTGMKGTRNEFHHDLAQMGKPVTIPPTLQTRLRNMSLGDYKRALGDSLSDWEIGQTYLRGKYVLHLHDTEGHIDSAKFMPTFDNLAGSGEMPLTSGKGGFTPHKAWHVNNSPQQGMMEFMKRQEDKTLPNDLFNSFAKKFINDHKGSTGSAHHAAATELDQIGVFMPGESTVDPKAYRREGRHTEYAKTVEAKYPDAQVGHRKPLAEGTPASATTEPGMAYDRTVKERRGGVDRRENEGTVSGFTKNKRKNPRGRRKGE